MINLSKRKSTKSASLDLFGNPIMETKRPKDAIIPLEFESSRVRMFVSHGVPWWVGADACAVLEHTNSRVALARLDDDDKGVRIVYTPGGPQEMTVVNESGLYNLIFTSRKPEAKRFKHWVTHEVLPTIRRTGSYSISHRNDRISQVARRLKVDRTTAKIRCDQIALNRSSNLRLASEGANPFEFREWHNAAQTTEKASLPSLAG